MNIDERIKELEDEQQKLVTAHDSMVSQFQQLILNNRNRYQQLAGAIDELKKLVQPQGDNNDNSIPTLDLSDRTLDVCSGR